MFRKFSYLSYLTLILALTTVPAIADPFQQDQGPDGIVSIEAENFDENIPAPPHTWELITESASGFLTGGWIQRRLCNAVNAHNAGGR